jgi:hypothetical protein
MGDGVNIAARLEGVPGAICLSEQAYWQVKGRPDLKVTDLGAKPLKNIGEPIRLYSLEVGQPAEAKPAPSALTMVMPESGASTSRATNWPSRWLALSTGLQTGVHIRLAAVAARGVVDGLVAPASATSGDSRDDRRSPPARRPFCLSVRSRPNSVGRALIDAA